MRTFKITTFSKFLSSFKKAWLLLQRAIKPDAPFNKEYAIFRSLHIEHEGHLQAQTTF